MCVELQSDYASGAHVVLSVQFVIQYAGTVIIHDLYAIEHRLDSHTFGGNLQVVPALTFV